VQIVGEKRRSSRHGGHSGSRQPPLKRASRSLGVCLPHDTLREKGRELSLEVQRKQATLAFQVRLLHHWCLR
jgi:hypothetical protein